MKAYRFLKRIVSITAIIYILSNVASAETLPLFFGKSNSDAPYEQVNVLDEPPFDEGVPILDISVLGIKMGDCIIVECGGKRMLIDGGESNRFKMLDSYCKARGIDSFDVIYLTHCHDDHTDAQKRLIKANYNVGLFISPYSEKDTYDGWTEYL